MTNTKQTFNLSLPTGQASIATITTEEGSTFFNATELWKLAGSDKAQRPDQYLRSEKAQEYIVHRFENLNDNGDFQKLSHGAFKFKADKALSAEITAPFVKATKGRYGATYFDYNVFVDYAQYLSAEFKDTLIETFKRFGFIYTAPINKQTDLLLDVARENEIQMILDDRADYSELNRKQKATTMAHASARIKQKETTKQLHELVAIVWGAESSQDRAVSGIIQVAEGIINRVAIGASRETLSENLGISFNSYNRDVLKPSSLNCITAATAEICQYLLDCIEDEIVPATEDFKAEVGRISKKARTNILFRNNRQTRVIAETTKKRSSDYGNRGLYQVELKRNLEIESLYTPLDKDVK